eukprot:4552719-Lingulodinium_polyedra.AAC.1
MLSIGRLMRQDTQHQLIALNAEAIVTYFCVIVGGLHPRLATSDSGGRRDRSVRFTTRTVAGA